MVVGDPTYIHPGTTNTSRVYCSDGDAAVGGGHFHWSGDIAYIDASRPIGSTNPVGWTTSFYNESSHQDSVMTAMATCLDLTP
jgi:hypothetical protein